MKISFDTVQQLMDVKKDLVHVVEINQAKFEAVDAYESILAEKRYSSYGSNIYFSNFISWLCVLIYYSLPNDYFLSYLASS